MITHHVLYGGDVEIDFDDEKHLYIVTKPDIGKVPGCTSITDLLNKPALIPWYLNKAQGEAKKLLVPGEIITEELVKQVLEGIKSKGNKEKEKAGDIGTAVHEWISAHIKSKIGFNEPLPMPSHAAVHNGVSAFLQWEAAEKPVWEDSESIVYLSDAEVAGTRDAIARFGNKRRIVDFKSSTGIWDEYWIQLGGYYAMSNAELPYSSRISEGMILRLDKMTGAPEPSPVVPEVHMSNLGFMFRDLAGIYKWKYSFKKLLKDGFSAFQVEEALMDTQDAGEKPFIIKGVF